MQDPLFKFGVSERRACCVLKQLRSAVQYEETPREDEPKAGRRVTRESLACGVETGGKSVAQLDCVNAALRLSCFIALGNVDDRQVQLQVIWP